MRTNVCSYSPVCQWSSVELTRVHVFVTHIRRVGRALDNTGKCQRNVISAKLAAIVLATAASSAVAAPACNAQRYSGGVYYSFSVEAGFGPIAVTPGQTITATLVDLKTCEPFALDSFSSAQLTRFSTSVLDVDSNYEDFPNSVNGTSIVGNKIVAYAGVPNGSPHLSLSAGVEFAPGGLDNWYLITKNLGVVFTIA